MTGKSSLCVAALCVTLSSLHQDARAQESQMNATGTTELRELWRRALTQPAEPGAMSRMLEAAGSPERRQEEVLSSTTPFVDPPSFSSNNGYFATTLVVDYADFAIGSHRVRLRTYNNSLVGPTFRVKPGDVLEITVKNRLPEERSPPGGHNNLQRFNTTNLHTHGLHVSPKGRSDNVLLEIVPGEEFKYLIEIPENHPAGTFWYHAHRHGSVAAQVSSGMSGTIIVEGGLDLVPEIRAAKERVFLLQQIPYVLEHGIGVIEERYAALSFGPHTWDALGRHTTINGQQFPTLTINEGGLERWRFVHGGVREGLGLRLVGVEGNAKGKLINFTQIARDGLPLGKSLNSQYGIVELFPGYRADVLVKIPKEDYDGIYLLEDAAITPAVSGFTQNAEFHPKYIAKVVVPNTLPMTPIVDKALPAEKSLALVKQGVELLKDLEPETKDGEQVATYSIRLSERGAEFFIDGHSYDETRARQLKGGSLDEWTLKSDNGEERIDHPFHIHVNPFQIISIVDHEGNGVADDRYNEMKGWRDTLLLRNKWTYKVRMKYHTFTGKFVQHCHILDHEDQGMMELLEILGPESFDLQKALTKDAAMTGGFSKLPAKVDGWDLRAADNSLHRLAAVERPAVVVFYRGQGCLSCVEQLQAIAAQASKFEAAGIELIAISPESNDELKTALRSYEDKARFPFTLLSDPQRKAFVAFGCNSSESDHAMFLLNKQRQVVWQKVSKHPFTDVEHLLREVAQMKISDRNNE